METAETPHAERLQPRRLAPALHVMMSIRRRLHAGGTELPRHRRGHPMLRRALAAGIVLVATGVATAEATEPREVATAGTAVVRAPSGHPATGPGRSQAHIRTNGLVPRTDAIGPASRPAAPIVGTDIAATTQVCSAGMTRATPTTSAQCGRWSASGPVNVVIVSHGAAPDKVLMAQGRWRPALGGWLVARATVLTATPGCRPGLRDSMQQAELRIDPTDRRHFKFFSGCGTGGSVVAFGEAHTDNFDLHACGGDHMTDLDHARDALVAAFLAIPGTTVEYRQDHPSTQTYPGGCGRSIASDGRVAYVVLAG